MEPSGCPPLRPLVFPPGGRLERTMKGPDESGKLHEAEADLLKFLITTSSVRLVQYVTVSPEPSLQPQGLQLREGKARAANQVSVGKDITARLPEPPVFAFPSVSIVYVTDHYLRSVLASLDLKGVKQWSLFLQ